MTVKFKEVESALACVQRMNGRFFAQRQIQACQMEKKEKFRQSSSRGADDSEEAERLRAYEEWLDQQD
jgi:HIV Tat-specific factor 1